MGGNQSLMDTRMNLKLQSNEALKMHYKCLKEEEDERLLVKSAIELRNNDTARMHAANSVRKRHEAIRFLEFKSRLDLLTAQVDSAIRTQKLTTELKRSIPHLNRILKNQKIESVDVMKNYRNVFDELNLKDTYLNETMDNNLVYMAPAEEVENLIKTVAEENEMDLEELLKGQDKLKSLLSGLQMNKSLAR